MRNPQKMKKEAMVEQKKGRIIEYLSVSARLLSSASECTATWPGGGRGHALT